MSALLCGCLFPSVDDLGGGVPADPGDAGASSSAPTKAPSSTSTPSAADASSPSAPDASTAPAGGTVSCGSATCNLAAEFCCTTIGGNQCQGPETAGFCTTVEGGEILRCDGSEDCAGGAVCCYLASEKTASCRTSCPSPGKTLCHDPSPVCPAGQACNGTLQGGHKVCQ